MSWPKGPGVEVGGHGVVSHAGSAVTRLLADWAGLTAALSGALPRRGFAPLHDRGLVLAGLAVAIADGATTITEIDTLRHQGELSGPVASEATAWRTLAGCDAAKVRRHVWGLIAARHGGIPAACAAGRDLGEVIVIRLHATIVAVHSDKQQAKGTFKGTWGFHPLTAWCDNTDESLAVELRPGNAGSNTAAGHIAVAGCAVAQIPGKYRRKMLFTCDGAGSAHALSNTSPGSMLAATSVRVHLGLEGARRRLPQAGWTDKRRLITTGRQLADIAEAATLRRQSRHHQLPGTAF